MNNNNINELIEKYKNTKFISIEDFVNSTDEEKEIYMSIDFEGLESIKNTTEENIDKIKSHLSLDNLRKIKEFCQDNGEIYLRDINLIAALSKLPVCQEYKLLISDLIDVAESKESLTSELHDENMKSLFEIITSNNTGSLKESQSFAILMAATKGKLYKTEEGYDYPATYLDDLDTIKRTTNEDSAYAIGNIMVTETKNNYRTRSKYIKEISKLDNLDLIEILEAMATNYYAIHSYYYGTNLDYVINSENLDELVGIIATNEDSLESKYHLYNLSMLEKIRYMDKQSIIETLTNIESLESESHMRNIEEKIENYGKGSKTLKKVMN